jgi:hypothetical protein
VKRFLDSVDRFIITVGESVSEIGKSRPQFWSEYQVRSDVIGKLKKEISIAFFHIKSHVIVICEDMPNQSENIITDSYASRGPRYPLSALASPASRLMRLVSRWQARSVRRR